MRRDTMKVRKNGIRMMIAVLRNSLYLIIGFVLLASSLSAHAARHALVIGNSDYGSGYDLATPVNDSTAVAEKLASIGYQVHGGGARVDLNLEAFNSEIDSFLASVEDGATTLIYYAGHGAVSDGSNYLIPILPEGVRLRSESDIRNRSVLLQGIVERVERKNPTGVNVFFFDACRDAPVENFSRTINLTGLTDIDSVSQPRGSFIGFSTEYGKIALDGDPSGNSPFATALLDSLNTHATAPIELFFKAITEQVYDNTQGQQFPIQESKLRGEHCISDCGAALEIATPVAPDTDADSQVAEASAITDSQEIEQTPKLLFRPPEIILGSCGSMRVLGADANNSTPTEMFANQLVQGQLLHDSTVLNADIWQVTLEPGNYHLVADASVANGKSSGIGLTINSVTSDGQDRLISVHTNDFDVRSYEFLEIDVAQTITLKVEPRGTNILTYQMALISNGNAVPAPRFTLCPAISEISLNQPQRIPGFSKIRTIDDHRWFGVNIPAGLYALDVTGKSSDSDARIAYTFDLFERFGEFGQANRLGQHSSYVSREGPIATNSYEVSARHNSVVWIRARDAADLIDVEFTLRPF